MAMETLEDFKNAFDSYKRQLAAKLAERRKYMNIANEIGAVYDRMADDKKAMKEYRNGLKSFANEPYDTFRGKLYLESYKVSTKALAKDYDVVIGNIDTNMDRLNLARCKYENMAYECDGVIGWLETQINTVSHTIQNWIN